MYRLLLLEDDPSDADLILQTLKRDGLDVLSTRVNTRDEFILALRHFEPDVVLSDHSLGQFNALAALEILGAMRPVASLIVVSGASDERMTVACLRAGAEDVFSKGNLSTLSTSIRQAIHARRPLERLTPRQLQVLRMVAAGEGTPSIARQLGLSVKTVETHRAAIMKRLAIHDLAALVRYAIRVGFVFIISFQ